MIGNYEMKYLVDRFNEYGTRNLKNVSRGKFNCGGYALGTYNWILPCDTDEDADELFEVNLWLEDIEDIDFDRRAEICATWMLNNIPNLRRVDSPDEKLADDEWLIGFKMGLGPSGDGDFHYIKRTPTGRFYHKPGSAKIMRMSKKEALSDSWMHDSYTSNTIWLVRKK